MDSMAKKTPEKAKGAEKKEKQQPYEKEQIQEWEETVLNLRGLKCPLPALRTRKALSAMASGELLVIECTDPLTTIDIPNLINQTGDRLEATSRAKRILTFRIRKR
jgi:tRNA 2-thiouridine synthesizing protein A